MGRYVNFVGSGVRKLNLLINYVCLLTNYVCLTLAERMKLSGYNVMYPTLFPMS